MALRHGADANKHDSLIEGMLGHSTPFEGSGNSQVSKLVANCVVEKKKQHLVHIPEAGLQEAELLRKWRNG